MADRRRASTTLAFQGHPRSGCSHDQRRPTMLALEKHVVLPIFRGLQSSRTFHALFLSKPHTSDAQRQYVAGLPNLAGTNVPQWRTTGTVAVELVNHK